MSELKRRKLEELIRHLEIHYTSEYLVKYLVFKLYISSKREPYEYRKENKGIDKVPALLEELKEKYGFRYEIIDTSKMSYDEIKAVYTLCAHWAMTSFSGRRIYEIFRGYGIVGGAGDLFGKEIPALLVYSFTGIVCVFPHQVTEDGEEEIITIYDFLKALKEHLESSMHTKT